MQDLSRAFKLNGASNFRDLGGYTGHGGRKVQWRKIFRSDHLGALTEEDLQELSALGLSRVCDFRGSNERVSFPCAMPGVEVHSLAIEPSIVQGMQDMLNAGRTLTADDTVRMMQETYRNFVRRNADRFAALFHFLLQDDRPLVFHCTAGKDRTGFAAALILETLGVSRADIMQDYLLTNDLFKMPDTTTSALPMEVLQVLWRVQAPFLDAAMHAVDEDYGGVAGYLEKGMGIDAKQQQRLVETYLQPAA